MNNVAPSASGTATLSSGFGRARTTNSTTSSVENLSDQGIRTHRKPARASGHAAAAGGTYGIDWRGKLSDDGKKITDGKFSLIMGSGTFTAEKQ